MNSFYDEFYKTQFLKNLVFYYLILMRLSAGFAAVPTAIAFPLLITIVITSF